MIAELLLLPLVAADPVAAEAKIESVTFAYPGDAKRNQASFLHEGALYVFGGTRSLDPRDFSPPNFVEQAYRIDIKSRRVEPIATPPVPIMSAPTVVATVDGKTLGVLAGGLTHDGERFQVSDRVHLFDFAEGKWLDETIALPYPVTLSGITLEGAKATLYGGWRKAEKPNGPGPGLEVTGEIIEIDLAARKAKVVGEMPTPRRSFAAVRLGGTTYALGGLNEEFQYVEACDAFRHDRGQWVDYPEPPTRRAMPQAVAAGNRIVVAGGFSSGKPVPPFVPNTTLVAFVPSEKDGGSWTRLLDVVPGSDGGSTLQLFSIDERTVLGYSIEQDKAEARLTFIELP